MIRIAIIFLLFNCCHWVAYGQRANFDEIVQPVDKRAKEFKELLVQLAWLNNPMHDALKSEQLIADQNIEIEKRAWTRDITVSFNINEGNIAPRADNLFFPIYNLGATFNIGHIITMPHRIKIAKEQHKITAYNIDQQKLKIRGEVLRRYQTYLGSIELLKARTEAVENLLSTFLITKENFNQGLATLEEFNIAADFYSRAVSNKVISDSEVLIHKLSLEELIGVTLEKVEKGFRPKNQR